ncbi:hypothetical protein [Pseudorhodoferax soli]|uniref:hypothetical protein n=1 Tax=Pseudorhodoferax soli TaxID=545864 RepID=UPI0011C07A59|nr:hypothetical protein [Pseudorhodoferax soli]
MFDMDVRMGEPTLERIVGVDVAKGWLAFCADSPTPDLAAHTSYEGALLRGVCDVKGTVA